MGRRIAIPKINRAWPSGVKGTDEININNKNVDILTRLTVCFPVQFFVLCELPYSY